MLVFLMTLNEAVSACAGQKIYVYIINESLELTAIQGQGDVSVKLTIGSPNRNAAFLSFTSSLSHAPSLSHAKGADSKGDPSQPQQSKTEYRKDGSEARRQ